jgi:single-stranded-DNA-specific exonuclease
MPKRWRIAVCDMARAEFLQQRAQLPPLLAQLLLVRGIECPDQAREFLEAKLTGLRDPAELPGLNAAADLVFAAIGQGKKIAIYGDYDADGMTASAILLRCLRVLGVAPRSYVPHRLDEGYGLHTDALETLAAEGVQMVITVDCGIASLSQAERARELGLTLVVTDHHQFADRLPAAAAIVHPQLPGHNYPFAGLCGAAVAFKLAWALCERASGAKRVQPTMRKFLLEAIALAAIGTVADVVPLVDENRLLVRDGLLRLSQCPPVGIAALKRATGLDSKPGLECEDIGFTIAPRLNAAGRLGQAEIAIELLTTEDPARADELACFIGELNEQRQSLERSVLLAATKQIKQRFDPARNSAFVLADHHWHPGVIGIVAGKIAERYNRPTVLVALDKLGIKPGIGSGRSIAGVDLHRAFAACDEHLESHGGHAAAAGLRVSETKLVDFRKGFMAAVADQIAGPPTDGEITIDSEAPFAMLTHQVLREIERLAPFGNGNHRPVLCSTGVRIVSPPKRIGGAGRHLSVEFEQDGRRVRGVAFGGGDWADELASAKGLLDIAYQPVINHFRGAARVEIHLTDWRMAE